MRDTVDEALRVLELQATERTQVLDPDAIEIGDGTSLDLLRAVYRNSALPLSVRMRAASMALPFEVPKLSVAATIGLDPNWPDRMEELIAKRRAKQIEAKQIEANVVGLVTRR
jgi:hypothetical protein